MATVVLSPVYVCVCVSICVKNVLARHYTPARSLELPFSGFLFFRPTIPATPVDEKIMCVCGWVILDYAKLNTVYPVHQMESM